MERILELDQIIRISVTDDKLTSLLKFADVGDDFTVTFDELQGLARANSIVHGLDTEVLLRIAIDPQPYLLAETVIARGTPPVNGTDGYVHYLYGRNNDTHKPVETEDGRVDLKEVSTLNNINKGQLIGKKIPPTEGTPGKAVTGEPLQARAGKEARFKLGKNVVTDAEENAIYAAIDGLVTYTDRNKVNVFPVYEVNGDVDYRTGNIDFVGTVVIRGNVSPGFKIKASGDIRIVGGVEAAELEASGSVEITAGIVGRNKAVVRAGKNVKSSFIQDATVEAAETITVSQSILHSTIRAGKTVACNGPKGLIVGGTVQAGEKVIARTIGNSLSNATAIEVGVLPELRNELIQLRSQLKVLADNQSKTDKALILLDQLAASGQLGPDKVALRIKLNHTKRQAGEEQRELRERIFEMEKSLEDSDRSSVEVISTVYGGAKIVIGRYTKFIKDPMSHVVFQLVAGDIGHSAYMPK
ncbi:DUF342 domain-containing protein [Paenibacillus sp. UNC499MF]|uniref:DUF342 domain-containing protein n=1 Tax=Paenibacillus sp. UNC499MF TaxID=1502751 RepID=UPI0008A04A63|nr:FapA family protein [Paenibacillus sp. UNC499MF]SEF58683.1 hypothetical protein SAMN02799616_00564 [Paenibacillus sp. UNC499MF]